MTAAQADAALAEQSIEAAAAEQRNADRQLAQLAQRRERLREEQASIGSPDEVQLASLKQQLIDNESEVAAGAESQQRSEANVDRMTEQRQQRVDDRVRQGEVLARTEAHLQALKQVQASVEANAKLDPWLRAQGLENLPRLFRKLVVEPGWETASRRCCASAYRESKSANWTRSAAWPPMRRRRALLSIQPAMASPVMRAVCRR